MKQRNIPWVGAFIESLFNALPFLSILISMFNFFSIILVLYSNIKPYMTEYVPNITLPVFIGCVAIVLVFIVITVMIIVYKYVNPSLWTFRNKQMNQYDSEVLNRLKEIEKRLDVKNERI
jgi:divalent metal cation (Fe/Co/Zn/Cd) transporter